MADQQHIHENSSRIAKNTFFMYFRMFLLMAIGLFTSRVVLKTLGVEDYGTYNAVAGFVTMFTVVTSSITSALSRYITFALGQGDRERLRRIFSASVVIQIGLCILVFLLTETFGVWFLHARMNIPAGRAGAAGWVLQCAMGVLMVNLLSVPFNSVIMAHEHMRAFAYISILEAALKLAVALLLFVSSYDKLKVYAVLMLAVAVLVRFAYSAYCRRHFEESRSRAVFDRALIREMTGFAGWNFLGSSAFLFNTQGINLLTNLFFGVTLNAARGVAGQVENMVKQFAVNVAYALNPQITKSYATGDLDYAFGLVCKGAKYYFLILFTLTLPFLFEAGLLLDLWLEEVPEHAPLFVRLALLCVIADFTGNTLTQLMISTGNVKRYYIITSSLTVLVFPVTWALFAAGAAAWTAYLVFLLAYSLLLFVKLGIVHRQTGLSVWQFVQEALLRMLYVIVPSVCVTAIAWHFVQPPVWQLLAVLFSGTAMTALTAYLFALSKGERDFINDKIKNIFQKRLHAHG